jgi:multiple sugar transport system permease protein
MKNLHWIDTYWALIVPGITGAFSIFLFRQFFLSLPKDFADAAQVDGCGHYRFLAKIGIPLAKSTALTVGLLAFIDEWNSTLWPLIVTNKDEMRVLQVALKIFSDIDTGMGWNVMMAACLLCTLPIVVAFFFVQKQFIDGIASSGVKG